MPKRDGLHECVVSHAGHVCEHECALARGPAQHVSTGLFPTPRAVHGRRRTEQPPAQTSLMLRDLLLFSPTLDTENLLRGPSSKLLLLGSLGTRAPRVALRVCSPHCRHSLSATGPSGHSPDLQNQGRELRKQHVETASLKPWENDEQQPQGHRHESPTAGDTSPCACAPSGPAGGGRLSRCTHAQASTRAKHKSVTQNSDKAKEGAYGELLSSAAAREPFPHLSGFAYHSSIDLSMERLQLSKRTTVNPQGRKGIPEPVRVEGIPVASACTPLFQKAQEAILGNARLSTTLPIPQESGLRHPSCIQIPFSPVGNLAACTPPSWRDRQPACAVLPVLTRKACQVWKESQHMEARAFS